MTNIDKIKANVTGLIEDFEKLKAQVDEVQKWNSATKIVKNFKAICFFVINLVMLVELTVKDLANELVDFKSEEKLEAAAQLLDEYIKLPVWAEPFDNYVFKCVLSTVVTMIDAYVGKQWDIDSIKTALQDPEITNLSPSPGS